MHILWKIIWFISLQTLTMQAIAKPIQVDSVSYKTHSTIAQLVFNISAATPRNIFFLDNPNRLVIDFENAKLTQALKQPPVSHPFFKRIRSGIRNQQDLRVVVDLNQNLNQRNFIVAPNKKNSYKMVVDVFTPTHKHRIQTVKKKSKSKPKIAPKTPRKRGIVIAIDAGHGGIDEGAKGQNGTQEKHIVLAIAKKLAKLIDKHPNMRALMIRKSDYFIKLRHRMEIARAAKADLFISIHADAFQDSSVRGASVYTLSEQGASSEAAHWLANHENSADLVGGVSLDDKDDILASVLLDLSQSATTEASRNVAAKVLKHFKKVLKLHQDNVQEAAFAVLKSPDIPSILVETAFISNPDEEKNLRSQAYQQKIANAIFKGVIGYFSEYSAANMRSANFHTQTRIN